MFIILDAIKAIILGIVEGFTEFLPISSTGHLILVNQFVSFDKAFTTFLILLYSLEPFLRLWYFFGKGFGRLPKTQNKNKEILNIWYKTIVGVLPAIVLGALFASIIEKKLFNPWVVAIALLFGGLIILFIERKIKDTQNYFNK